MARYLDADKMREEWLENGENEFIYDTNSVLDSIDSQPTADVVEVKHGEWEKFEIPHMMRCSECGVGDLDIHRTKFAFCPYCGAKMKGGAE